jgi:hypothetical protein
VTSVGDSFSWPFQDPGWAGKLIVQGLIAIIPIVGWIAIAGWLMMTIDNYRAGRKELPPAGFHLERGIPIFLVLFVYGLVFAIPSAILGIVAGSNDNNASIAAVGNLIGFLLSLLLAFLAPAIILQTYRAGFAGGFDVAGIWATATGNVATTVLAGLLIYVARIIGGIGFFLCCVGLLFTIPYSLAITAGIVVWYERQLAAAGPTPSAPPAPS